MTNYEQLKKYEEEKQKLKNEMDEAAFMDMEPDIDFLVQNKITGQKGYAESYIDSTDVCFIVPSEDLTEYRVTAEQFNRDFVIESRPLLQSR